MLHIKGGKSLAIIRTHRQIMKNHRTVRLQQNTVTVEFVHSDQPIGRVTLYRVLPYIRLNVECPVPVHDIPTGNS